MQSWTQHNQQQTQPCQKQWMTNTFQCVYTISVTLSETVNDKHISMCIHYLGYHVRNSEWQTHFNVYTLSRYPFHPRITAVARKRSWSVCQKSGWQVTAKHTYTLPMWLWMKWHCKLVHGWMGYTQLTPRRRQHFTWHQPFIHQRALPVHHIRGY